jgi:GT2 family glycosyltransferase
MSEPLVTIVVVPRERFSLSARSLETLYRETEPPFRLVYVDAGFPSRIRHHLESESRRRGFQIVRTEHYLSPNQARNLGLRLVTTKYVVFLDNDVIVTPGWLRTLVTCAEETDASVVGPLYLMGELTQQIVHMAGGTVEFEGNGGVPVFREHHHFPHTPLSAIEEPLIRRAVDVVEFHCMLVRREVFTRLGRLDEGLLSANEHIDLCLSVKQSGGLVYLEPRAVVTYIGPRPLAASDLPYFLLRWSDAWNAASIRHFNRKWNVRVEDDFSTWLTDHRRTFLEPLHRQLHRVVGWRIGTWIERVLVHPVETASNRLIVWAASKPSRRADTSPATAV